MRVSEEKSTCQVLGLKKKKCCGDHPVQNSLSDDELGTVGSIRSVFLSFFQFDQQTQPWDHQEGEQTLDPHRWISEWRFISCTFLKKLTAILCARCVCAGASSTRTALLTHS